MSPETLAPSPEVPDFSYMNPKTVCLLNLLKPLNIP